MRRGGGGRGGCCDQVEARGGRKSEEETNAGEIDPCDRGGWGKRAVLQTQWMLWRTKDKGGRRVQGRSEKEETGQECMDECVVLRATRPRRLSRERVSELSLESPLCLAQPAVRIRGRRYPCRADTPETGAELLYIIHT